MEMLEPGINFFNREMRFDADDFAHSVLIGDPVQSANLLRWKCKISVFKKRIGMKHLPRSYGSLARLIPTTPLSLAFRFSAFTMGEIGLVIAPLDPRHTSEALFNRIGMQGQHDLE
jgi:hypothetical protein